MFRFFGFACPIFGTLNAGNVTSRDTDGDGNPDFTFEYDGSGHMRKATKVSDQSTELYYYDNTGTRYLVVSSSTPRVRMWFGSVEVWFDDDTIQTVEKAFINVRLGTTVNAPTEEGVCEGG